MKTPPRLTAADAAHNIVDELFHLPFGTDQNHAGEWLEKQIVQAVSEAYAEASVDCAKLLKAQFDAGVELGKETVVDRHGHVAIDILLEASKEGYEKGFAEAAGRAAGLAEYHSGPSVQLAKKIRALRPGGEAK